MPKTLNSSIQIYSGSTEMSRRLVFPYGESFQQYKVPSLYTLLSNGISENEPKMLAPGPEKGLITLAGHQEVPAAQVWTSKSGDKIPSEITSQYCFNGNDGRCDLAHIWTVKVNEDFEKAFTISTENPDPGAFSDVAMHTFKAAIRKLWPAVPDPFDPEKGGVQCLYASKESVAKNDGNDGRYTNKVYVGSRDALLKYFRGHANDPDVRKLNMRLGSARDKFDFQSIAVDGNDKRSTINFSMGRGPYAVYQKQGWDTMATPTPLDVYRQSYNLGEPVAMKKPTAKPAKKPTAVAAKKPTAVAAKKPTAVAAKKPTAVAAKKPTPVAAKLAAAKIAKPVAKSAVAKTANPAIAKTANPKTAKSAT